MKSKLMLTLVALTMAIALVAGGTMAWFTDQDTVGNAEFVAGTVIVNADLMDGQVVAPLGAVLEDKWNPGDTTTVTWIITNEGTKAMVFRILPEVSVSGPGLSYAFTQAWNGENLRGSINPAGATDWIIEVPGGVTANWNDHIYYYENVVPANGTVTLIMDVTLKGSETGNNYQGATFKIGGKVEAVQASNFAAYHVWGVTHYGQPSP